MVLPGLRATETTGAYAMDRHEVTNREYKRFVDAGGYADPKYWRQPFLEAVASSLGGRRSPASPTAPDGQGPATWEVGSYPEGREEYPVSGVSWYEAAAYAEWAGKSLPTVFHWNQVAFTVVSAQISPWPT